MTHPLVQHARAAAHAVRAARGRLAHLAGLEARANATRRIGAAATAVAAAHPQEED